MLVVSDLKPTIVVFPGSGGGAPNLNIFRKTDDDAAGTEVIEYPGWRRYIERDFSAEAWMMDLAIHITNRVPSGPIRIVGVSIGGHFGYAVAIRLQAAGREIAGFCAIDSFMVRSAAPSVGWQRRAFALAMKLLRGRRIEEFGRFLRSRFWRSLLRSSRDRLPNLLRRSAMLGRLPWFFRLDPIFEQELSMRLLTRGTAPWLGSLDREPVALNAPTLLLRTPSTAGDDATWQRRCPGIRIIQINGDHQSLFEPGNVSSLSKSYFEGTRDWR